MGIAPSPGLDIGEDRAFQERFWSAERAAWIAFAGFLVAALLGFLGAGGPFSRVTVRTGPASVEYPRVARMHAIDHIDIRFAPGSEKAVVTFDREFTRLFAIQRIQPTPSEETATAGGKRVVIDLSDQAAPNGGRVAREVVVTVRAVRIRLGRPTRLILQDDVPVRLPLIALP